MIVRGDAAALLALASILAGCACDGPEVADAPPSPPVPHDPATVIVPQVLPHAPEYFGWLDDERALLVERGIGYVWEPATDRVLAVLAHSELGAVLPWNWPTDEYERTLRTPFGTVLSRSFTADRDLSVDGDEIHARFAIGNHGEGVVFSPDHRRALVCDETGVTVRELERGRVVARREGAVNECVWEGDLIAIMADDGVEVLHADTLERAFDPIEHVSLAAPSRDGTRLAVVLRGSREGISVIDLATGEERMHRSMPAPQRLGIVGDSVFYSSVVGPEYYGSVPVASIRGGVLSARGGNVIVEEAEDVESRHLGPAGVLMRTETGIVMRQASGAIVRPGAVSVASIEIGPIGDTLAVTSAARRWWVDATLSARAFGVCPERPRHPFSLVGSGSLELVSGEHHYLVAEGCVAHDDGRSVRSGFTTIAIAADGTHLVQGATHLELREPSGELRAAVALDPGEALPCMNSPCTLPVAFAPDGTFFVLAAGPRLRTFDLRTGARIGEAAVPPRTNEMVFARDLLVHDAQPFGPQRELSIFEVPSLRRRGGWLPAIGPHPTSFDSPIVTSFAVIEREDHIEIAEVAGGVLRRMSMRGVMLGEAPVPGASGLMVLDGVIAVRGEQTVTLWLWPDLTPLGEVPGRLEAGGDGELVVCDGERAQRVTIEADPIEADPLRIRALDITCTASFRYFGRGIFAATQANGVALIRADDAVLSLLVALDGDALVWSGISDGVAFGAVPVMLRQPTMISEGMIDAPRGGSVADWMAGP